MPADPMIVGVLHPGRMGSSVAAAARATGAPVLWASEGRSEATRDRATADGLIDVGSLDALVERADVLVSVCPPHAAPEVARQVAARGFAGTFVDANAIAPATVRELLGEVTASGAVPVDAGIIGPPARVAGLTTLYLSGEHAPSVAGLFERDLLETQVVSGGLGAASALKMAFEAWTKGSAALLLAVRALSEAEGVTAGLLGAWDRLLPDLAGRSEAVAGSTAPKAWRFAGEMEEIAATFADVGLPAGFHEAAADVFGRLGSFRDADPPPDLARVVAGLLGPDPR